MKRDLTNVSGYIYKLVSPNGKIYIGQTINNKQRKYNYSKDSFKSQIKLWNSCKKHNWNPSDKYEIIEECLCGPNKEYLNEREKYWIEHYNSFKAGLNCNEGGHGNVGYKHSKESKVKMSKSALKTSKERSDRLSKIQTGTKKSDEFKEKVSKKLTGIKRSDEFKVKISEIAKKRVVTEETKNKISLTKKGKVSKKRKEIYQLGLKGDIIKLWLYAGEAEKELKITRGKISAVCLGNRNTTGGFKWKYKDEVDKK